MVDDDDEEEISTTGHESPSELKRIDSIQFGLYEIDSWYWSPYLDDDQTTTKLYICEYCLRYFKYKKNYEQHTTNGCTRYQPPGRKIYEHPNGLSVFEVDGQTAQLYCQCLCLLAKLFLDRKTIYFDVEGFLFYVLAKLDDNKRNTYHLLGYFSKEKFSDEGYNLACLMVLPPHQRQGYGKFLIALSYELTRLEKKTGSPEKPLSNLGQIGYKSYFHSTILAKLKSYINSKMNITIGQLSEETGICIDDVVQSLIDLQISYTNLNNEQREEPHVKKKTIHKQRDDNNNISSFIIVDSDNVVNLSENNHEKNLFDANYLRLIGHRR